MSGRQSPGDGVDGSLPSEIALTVFFAPVRPPIGRAQWTTTTSSSPSESHENGQFAWILDPDGNKVELWEPLPWDDKNQAG